MGNNPNSGNACRGNNACAGGPAQVCFRSMVVVEQTPGDRLRVFPLAERKTDHCRPKYQNVLNVLKRERTRRCVRAERSRKAAVPVSHGVLPLRYDGRVRDDRNRAVRAYVRRVFLVLFPRAGAAQCCARALFRMPGTGKIIWNIF
jgi:hypothetical protein